MTKQEFAAALLQRLSIFPDQNWEERVDFYIEMIEERMEDGMSEEEAVAQIGTIDEIISQILAEVPLLKVVNKRVKKDRRLKVWEIILIILGSPLWLSLLIAAIAVFIAVYICLWAIIIALWSIFASFLGSGFGGIVVGILFLCLGNTPSGLALLGGGILCVGLGIFWFFACKSLTKGLIQLTHKFGVWVKKLFLKKEVA